LVLSITNQIKLTVFRPISFSLSVHSLFSLKSLFFLNGHLPQRVSNIKIGFSWKDSITNWRSIDSSTIPLIREMSSGSRENG
jgi:hypothetical protein